MRQTPGKRILPPLHPSNLLRSLLMLVAELILGLVPVLTGVIDEPKPRSARLPLTCEVAMPPGMRILATTRSGTIVITAVDEVTRSYTWDGATRAIELEPHRSRYYGSLGLFHDPTDDNWRDNRGITGCSLKEGQQHFTTTDEALAWLKEASRPGACTVTTGWRSGGERSGQKNTLRRSLADSH